MKGPDSGQQCRSVVSAIIISLCHFSLEEEDQTALVKNQGMTPLLPSKQILREGPIR